MTDPIHDLDNVPDPLTTRDQWLHWDNDNETPRRPHKNGDYHVAWSDPDEWLTFSDAAGDAVRNDSWGIGYVTAVNNDDHAMGMVSVIDLDDAAGDNDVLAEWVPDLDPFFERDCYLEWSPSHHEEGASGIHIPVLGTDLPDWWSDSHIDGEHAGADLLSNKFCTVTGDPLEGSGDTLPTWDDWLVDWLAELYENITGDQPREKNKQTLTNGHSDSAVAQEDWLDEDTVSEALDYIDPNCAYPEWRDIGFALADHFDSHTARTLFDQWSRGSSKYDKQAEQLVEDITGRDGQGVTIGTLVHHAQEGGWEPDGPQSTTGTPSPRELVARHSDEYDSLDDVPQDLFDSDATADESPASHGSVRDGEGGGSDGSDGDDPSDGWKPVLQAYRGAESSDEMLPARYEATKQLMNESHWRTVIENDSLWVYDHEAGIYRPEGEARLRERLVEKLNEQFKAHEVREIGEQLRGRTTVREEEFGGPDGYIATENCVLELNKDGVNRYPHSPDYEFIGRVQTEYQPNADCPRFKSFLKESVNSREARKTLQEYAGYALMHWGLPHHKALFLVGPTASGKSTFLDTIRAMIGNDSTASLTPQQMTAERFGGANLYGTWANIRNDIPASVIQDTGQFKEIVAGDPIKAEEKYQDPFMFEPTAKHMFSANQLPDADTDDEAFFRRILLISFPDTVPREERDSKLDDKLQAELPGVLNWALEGLQRLMRTGTFSLDRSPGETQKTWQEWGNSCERFANTCLQDASSDTVIPKSDVYDAYLAFCDDEGIPSESQHMLTRELKTEGFADGRTHVDGKQQRVFIGLDWTGRGEEYSDPSDDDETATGGGGLNSY